MRVWRTCFVWDPAGCNSVPILTSKEDIMAVAKVSEITSESNVSFEDAIQQGIDRASKTIRGIRGAWVKEQKVKVENGKVASYRVDMKITFVLD